MFGLFKKSPEIPQELDFLASNKENTMSSPESPGTVTEQIITVNPSSSKKTWPRVLMIGILFIGGAAGGYWFVSTRNAPVPAEIPQEDVFASMISVPSAVPPGSISPGTVPKTTEQPSAALSPAVLPAGYNNVAGAGAKTSAVAGPPPTTMTPLDVNVAASPQQDIISGIFGADPFIDLTTLRGGIAASSEMELPHIGSNGNRALPDIPRPAVSPDLLPAPGEIRTPPAGPAGAVTAPATVGGIIKGANGNSIAIMGDGTVLSEGDSYKGDRRVTFIGGDGLQFDNGDSISFGEQK